jgi:hypothetical protein
MADRHLRVVKHPKFTPEAFNALKEHVKISVGLLILESYKLSKRYGLEEVSKIHVDHTSEFLLPMKGWRKHISTLGGTLLGAGISGFIAMFITNKIEVYIIIPLAFLLIVGTFLIALHWDR